MTDSPKSLACRHGSLRRVCLVCELEDRVVELEAMLIERGQEVYELRAKLRWRKVSEELPDVPDTGDTLPIVELVNTQGHPFLSAWDGGGWVAYSTLGGNRYLSNVNLVYWRPWLPIPEIPEEKP